MRRSEKSIAPHRTARRSKLLLTRRLPLFTVTYAPLGPAATCSPLAQRIPNVSVTRRKSHRGGVRVGPTQRHGNRRFPDMILVTAGILTDGDRILVCQRKAGDRFGLKWEFPGGKVEAAETPEACLRRELAEELGIEAEIGPEVHRTDYRYPNDLTVCLLFFKVLRYAGIPANRDFERIVWARPEALPDFDFLDADREIVARLARGERF